ncbi:MAG: hypothetical protein ACKVW3_17605 [Phycisphaerales bacterium]
MMKVSQRGALSRAVGSHPVLALLAAAGLAGSASAQLQYYGIDPVTPPVPLQNPPINPPPGPPNQRIDRGVIDYQLNPFNIAAAQVFVLDPDTGYMGVMEAPGAGWRQAKLSDPNGFGFPRPNPLYRRVWGPPLMRTEMRNDGPTNFGNGNGFKRGELAINGPFITKMLLKDGNMNFTGVSCMYASWTATFVNGPVPWPNGFWYHLSLADTLPARPVGGIYSELCASLHVTIVGADGTIITPPPLVWAVDNEDTIHTIAQGNFAAGVRTKRGPAVAGIFPPLVYSATAVNFIGPNTVPAFPVLVPNAQFTCYVTLTVLADPGSQACIDSFTPDLFNIPLPTGYNVVSGGSNGYSTSFESPAYNASPSGTVLTGQQGYTLPPVAGTVDFNVIPYAGNTLGIADNPRGNDQCAVGRSLGTTSAARAQRTYDFSGGGVWMAQWDSLGAYNGILPAVDNLGSFSLQDSAVARYWQQIMQWGTNTAAADRYNINFSSFPANSPPGTAPTFVSPGPAWTNIPVQHWVRQSITWDFTAGKILNVSIQNLTLNTDPVMADVSALNWYLRGGPGTSDPLPTAFRIFAGGGAGNITAWDNLQVFQVAPGVPQTQGSTCYVNCDASTLLPFLNVNDFICFNNLFAAGNPLANCDASTTIPTLNVNDFVCFNNLFAAGCSAP